MSTDDKQQLQERVCRIDEQKEKQEFRVALSNLDKRVRFLESQIDVIRRDKHDDRYRIQP